MYKLASHISKPYLFLVRKNFNNGTCTVIVVNTSRPYSNDRGGPCGPRPLCPPVPEPKKSNKLLWALFGAGMLTAAGVVYAKNTPEVRTFLSTNIPALDNIVAIVYEEDQTHGEFVAGKFYGAIERIRNFMFGKEGVSPMDFKSRAEQDIEAEAKAAFAPKTYVLPPPVLEPLYVEEKKAGSPEVEHDATLIQTDECIPQKPLQIKITKEVLELEQEMHSYTKIAMDAYKDVLKYCQEYNSTLTKLLETPGEITQKDLATLKSTRSGKDTSLDKGREASTKAKCAIETLERMINKKSIMAPPENLTQTRRYIAQFKNDLNTQEAKIKKECDEFAIKDAHWKRVEQARNMYREELEALYPGLDLCGRKLDLKGDTDLLLMYTMRQIQYLQNELAELQTIQEHKITRAIDCHDENELLRLKVQEELRKERIKQELEFQKKLLFVEKDATRQMREDLQKHYDMQDKVMKAEILKKEKEIMNKMQRELSELLEKERTAYKKELASMAGKLKAIDAALKRRAQCEQLTRKSQSLWAAGEALMTATRRPAPCVNVADELSALEKAGSGDKLVKSVLGGIPQETRDKGIVTEKALKERFDEVEKTTMKVALVDKDGATLPRYFLSWLQSKLMFQKLAEIPIEELENRPTDFSKLDTFDIMQRARYHMNNNDVASALRYINLLKGAPRAAAKPWASDARRFLEVRQAAEAVMAHASLASMIKECQ